MLSLKFFAALREALGRGEERLAIPPDVVCLGDLRVYLAARGGEWGRLTTQRSLRCALNQELADDSVRLADGDEIAFFPPVTGG